MVELASPTPGKITLSAFLILSWSAVISAFTPMRFKAFRNLVQLSKSQTTVRWLKRHPTDPPFL